MRSGLIIFGWVLACSSATAQPSAYGDDHPRRLAAELVVMTGDVRRLVTEQQGPLEKMGLEKRLAGALSSLPLLLRRAGENHADVGNLRKLLAKRDWAALSKSLGALKQRHPFDAHMLTDVKATPSLLDLGATIHKTTCGACHDLPGDTDTLLPAKNLSAQLRSMSRGEFAARLLLGIRGNKSTALANPYTESELAALIAWYSVAGR